METAINEIRMRTANNYPVDVSREEKIILALAANLRVENSYGTKIVKVSNGNAKHPRSRSWWPIDDVNGKWTIDGKPIDEYEFLWKPSSLGSVTNSINEIEVGDIIEVNGKQSEVVKINHNYHHHYGKRPATDQFEVWIEGRMGPLVFESRSAVKRIIQ